MSAPFQVAVLLSGRGSNLRSLIDNRYDFTIRAVLSNKADAGGLAIAAAAGIEVQTFPRASFASVAEQKTAIFDRVAKLDVDLIVLAGFMLIVPPEVAEHEAGRIVNIHPALLPAFPGIDTHARALASNSAEHGCTVHYLDSGVDTGPIIAQAAVSCRGDDDEHTLAARVLVREHQIYPWVVNGIARGEISLAGRIVTLSSSLRSDAAQRGFRLPASVAA